MILFKEWNRSEKFLFIYPLPALLTQLPIIPFTKEEITGCTNEAAKGDNKAQKNPAFVFFISSFTVSITHQLIHPNLLMIL